MHRPIFSAWGILFGSMDRINSCDCGTEVNRYALGAATVAAGSPCGGPFNPPDDYRSAP